jgi:hypothetical protein
MATASTSSRLLLRGAAVTAAGIALVKDVGFDEHPTHLVVLGFVAVVVGALHRRFMRNAVGLSTLPAVSAALAAQPVLHLTSTLDHPAVGTHDDGSLLHVVTSDAPAAGVQVVVPVVALIAVTVTAHLLYLLLHAVRSPLTIASAPCEAPARVLSPIRVGRLGSMLHWCGWVIRAARRGPPIVPGHAIS